MKAFVILALLLAASFMLAYGCAGNQPGAGLDSNEPPPPPPDDSDIAVVGVNDVPPPPPSG